MKRHALKLMLGLTAALLFSVSMPLASEAGKPGPTGTVLTVNDARVAYRYYYPRTGCYYVKKCVRVNRWGQCVKVKWLKKCGPRRVL